MKVNCQQSCHSCGTKVGDVNKPDAKPGLENKNELCQFWSSLRMRQEQRMDARELRALLRWSCWIRWRLAPGTSAS
jgi:hypothetical protein